MSPPHCIHRPLAPIRLHAGPSLDAVKEKRAAAESGGVKSEDDALLSQATGTAARVFLKAIKTARIPQPLTTAQVN